MNNLAVLFEESNQLEEAGHENAVAGHLHARARAWEGARAWATSPMLESLR